MKPRDGLIGGRPGFLLSDGFEALDDLRRRRHAEVAHDEQLLEVFPKLRCERLARAAEVFHGSEGVARLAQRCPETLKPAHGPSPSLGKHRTPVRICFTKLKLCAANTRGSLCSLTVWLRALPVDNLAANEGHANIAERRVDHGEVGHKPRCDAAAIRFTEELRWYARHRGDDLVNRHTRALHQRVFVAWIGIDRGVVGSKEHDA